MVLRLGLVVNPIAGIGGPAGLKGSDGVADQAEAAGYQPVAGERAVRFLRRLKQRAPVQSVRVFAAAGVMGSLWAKQAGWKCGTLGADTQLSDPFATDALDTEEACRYAIDAEMDLVVFVGGDGTARDVARVLQTTTPMLGVPSGVKMFSECFARTPEAAADLVAEIARGSAGDDGPPSIESEVVDVLDLDEEAYRRGVMDVRHHDAARVPSSPRMQSAKCPACPPDGLDNLVGEIRLRMEADADGLYVLAGGSTLKALKDSLGIRGALIGVDAVTGERNPAGDLSWITVAADADANRIDELVRDALAQGRSVTVVVTPIGGQGFVVGRGTAQLRPGTLRAALPERFWVMATAGKLASIEGSALAVDTGEAALDAAFPDYLRVVVGLERERLVPVLRG